MTLVIDNIYFERNQKILFHKLCGKVSAGEWLQIRGANGTGKSTLLRILAGLFTPQSGNVLWRGESIFRHREIYQQQIQYIGHQSAIKLGLTVHENLVLQSTLHQASRSSNTIDDVIEKMGLKKLKKTYAAELSAGQQRRLSLAKLLLRPCPVWLLDEPTTALDQTSHALLMTWLEHHLDTGGIAIIATHHDLFLQKPAKMIEMGDYNV